MLLLLLYCYAMLGCILLALSCKTQVANLMQLDAAILGNNASKSLLHQIWVAPLTFCMCLKMLYAELGVSCLSSIFVMAMMMVPQKFMFDKFLKRNSKVMQFRDQRVKVRSLGCVGLCGPLLLKLVVLSRF